MASLTLVLPGPPKLLYILAINATYTVHGHTSGSPQCLTHLVSVPMLVKLKPCKVLASSLAPASFLLFAVLSFTRAKGQGYQSWWFFIFTDMLLHMMLVLHQLYLLPSKPSIACWWPVVGRIVAILCLPCGAFSYQGQWTKVATTCPFAPVNFRFAFMLPTFQNLPEIAPWCWTKVANHFLPHVQLNFRFACALPNNIPKFVIEAILRDFRFYILQAWTKIAKFTLCANPLNISSIPKPTCARDKSYNPFQTCTLPRYQDNGLSFDLGMIAWAVNLTLVGSQ